MSYEIIGLTLLNSEYPMRWPSQEQAQQLISLFNKGEKHFEAKYEPAAITYRIGDEVQLGEEIKAVVVRWALPSTEDSYFVFAPPNKRHREAELNTFTVKKLKLMAADDDRGYDSLS